MKFCENLSKFSIENDGTKRCAQIPWKGENMFSNEYLTSFVDDLGETSFFVFVTFSHCNLMFPFDFDLIEISVSRTKTEFPCAKRKLKEIFQCLYLEHILLSNVKLFLQNQNLKSDASRATRIKLLSPVLTDYFVSMKPKDTIIL